MLSVPSSLFSRYVTNICEKYKFVCGEVLACAAYNAANFSNTEKDNYLYIAQLLDSFKTPLHDLVYNNFDGLMVDLNMARNKNIELLNEVHRLETELYETKEDTAIAIENLRKSKDKELTDMLNHYTEIVEDHINKLNVYKELLADAAITSKEQMAKINTLSLQLSSFDTLQYLQTSNYIYANIEHKSQTDERYIDIVFECIERALRNHIEIASIKFVNSEIATEVEKKISELMFLIRLAKK